MKKKRLPNPAGTKLLKKFDKHSEVYARELERLKKAGIVV